MLLRSTADRDLIYLSDCLTVRLLLLASILIVQQIISGKLRIAQILRAAFRFDNVITMSCLFFAIAYSYGYKMWNGLSQHHGLPYRWEIYRISLL